MKHKTTVIIVALTFIWWIVIFIDQLNRELSCTPTDEFCNSGNTFWGDFTWSLLLWAISMSIVTPIVLCVVLVQRNTVKKKQKKQVKKITLSKKKIAGVVAVGLVLVGAGLYLLLGNNEDVAEVAPAQEVSVSTEQAQDEEAETKPETTPAVAETPKPTPPVMEESPKWPVQLTNSQATSLTVVVNKKHKLPSDYVPDLTDVNGGKLRPEAAQALTSLLFKANEAGVPISIISSYRSYQTQVSTYNKWVNQSGQAAADTFSARPGHSEHQTGLAVDLGNGTCDLETCFGDTAAGIWLANNGQSYGFIIRYPSGKDATTGYQYEPWHLRYVGVDSAAAITASGQTMDEYYGVTAGDYQ